MDQTKPKLPNISALIDEMNANSSRFLELVSTMLYFDNLPKNEVEEKVLTVKSKQNFTEDEFREAWTFIERIKQPH